MFEEFKDVIIKIVIETKEASMKKRWLNNIEYFDDETSDITNSMIFKNKGNEEFIYAVQVTLN